MSKLGGLAICRIFIVATVCVSVVMDARLVGTLSCGGVGLSKLGGLAICRVFIVATVCQCGQRCKISWHTIMYDMLVSLKGLVCPNSVDWLSVVFSSLPMYGNVVIQVSARMQG